MKPTRETFAGRRQKPEIFGLERAALFPVAGAWTFAAIALTTLHSVLHFGWLPALALTAAPAAGVTAACLFLIQGKPAGYLIDWLEENILLCHEEEKPRRPKLTHPFAHAPRQRT